MTNRIVISAQPSTPVPVSLVGEEYLVRRPKAALGLLVAQRAKAAGDDVEKLIPEIEALVRAMFGPKQGKAVLARLTKADDELDYAHIFELVEKISEESSSNPTS